MTQSNGGSSHKEPELLELPLIETWLSLSDKDTAVNGTEMELTLLSDTTELMMLNNI